jgi:hypothetical protein
MKERRISYEQHSGAVHEFFRTLCKEDGMMAPRAAVWYAGVLIGQGGNPDIPDEVIEQCAP